MVVVDEAHLVPSRGSSQYMMILEKLWNDNAALRVLGLTATPFRTGSGYLARKDSIFDGIAYEISLLKLIEEGFLSPIVSKKGKKSAKESHLIERRGEFTEYSQGEAFKSNYESIADDTRIWYNNGRRSILIFTYSVKSAHDMAKFLNDRGIITEAVTGETPKEERERIVQEFRLGAIECVVNCNALTTGFDAPNIDLIVLARATSSLGLYIQMLGRGMRTFDGKVNCIMLDYGGNAERHGVIDQISVLESGSDKDKEVAKAKCCKYCNSLSPIGTAVCSECGNPFPKRKRKPVEKVASGAPVMSNQLPIQWLDVEHVDYARHQKQGKPDSLRIAYIDSSGTCVYEWLCPEHEGYARRKWLQRRPTYNSMADTTDQCVRECRHWPKPMQIAYRHEGKYKRVIKIEFPDHQNV